MTGPASDLCRCQHPAQSHEQGEGRCTECRTPGPWATLLGCRQFRWAYTWTNGSSDLSAAESGQP